MQNPVQVSAFSSIDWTGVQRSDTHGSILKFLGSSTDFPRDAIRSIEEWVMGKKNGRGWGVF